MAIGGIGGWGSIGIRRPAAGRNDGGSRSMRIARSPTIHVVDRSGAIEIVALPILCTAGGSGSIQILPSRSGGDDGGSGAMVIDRPLRRLAPAAVHAMGRWESADRNLPITIQNELAMRGEPAAPPRPDRARSITSDPDLPIPISPIAISPIATSIPIVIFPSSICSIEILPIPIFPIAISAIAIWIPIVIVPSPIRAGEILPIPIARDPDLPIEKIMVLPIARHSAGLRRRR